MMTTEQEAHLERARQAFHAAADKKYRAGVKEHGGNLWDNPPIWLLDAALEECIDQWMYLFTLRERLMSLPPNRPGSD